MIPFKKGIPWYTVTRVCHEDASVNLADAAKDIIFNCTAYEKVVNFDQRALLKFIQTGIAESDLTRRLNDMVEKQKKIEANTKLYFTRSLHDYDVKNEGRREGLRLGRRGGRKSGRKEGIEAKAIESARKLLTMKVLTHEQISEAVGLPLEKIEELALEINTAK